MSHAAGLGQKRQPSAVSDQTVGMGRAVHQVAWFLAVSVVAFLVPFLFSSGLDLQHDAYYLVYFAITLTVLVAYVRLNQIDVAGAFTRSWKLSLLVGVAATVFVVWSVLGRLDSTPHPDGAYFAFEIVWRGLFYGVVDALLLSAFPGLVAWKLMHHDIAGMTRRVMYGVLSLVLVMFITAAYHLGYEDLRNRDGIRNPELVAGPPVGEPARIGHRSLIDAPSSRDPCLRKRRQAATADVC